MDIIVCIKQVPGTLEVEVDPVTGILKRDSKNVKLNPYDLYALELAFELREKNGGTVRTVTMGPPQARQAILESVYMGADNGVVVSDRAFGGADVLATSYTLSQAILKMGRFDIVICGKQTTDGDTAQVGSEISSHLGIPFAFNVIELHKVKHDDNKVGVTINLEDSIVEETLPTPAIICTDGSINTPRLPSYRRRKATDESAVVKIMTLKDLRDSDPAHYGIKGSATQVERIFPPDKNKHKEVVEGDEEEQAFSLYSILKDRKFI